MSLKFREILKHICVIIGIILLSKLWMSFEYGFLLIGLSQKLNKYDVKLSLILFLQAEIFYIVFCVIVYHKWHNLCQIKVPKYGIKIWIHQYYIGRLQRRTFISPNCYIGNIWWNNASKLLWCRKWLVVLAKKF